MSAGSFLLNKGHLVVFLCLFLTYTCSVMDLC